MDANPIANIDPATAASIIGGMIPTAVIAVGWLIRTIIKNRKAAAKILLVGIDEKPQDSENSAEGNMNAALLQILRQIENNLQADRAERNRQWERLEQIAINSRDLTELARQQAQGLQAAIQNIQNFANYMDRDHRTQSDQIEAVASNQTRLSEWLRDRMGHFSPPPFRQSGA